MYNGFACIRYELGKDANMKNPNAQPRRRRMALIVPSTGIGKCAMFMRRLASMKPLAPCSFGSLKVNGSQLATIHFFLVDSRNRRKTNDKDFKHQVLISGFDPIREKSTRHKTRSAPKVQTRFTCTFQCHPTTEDLWECLILRSLHVQSSTFNIQQEG